MAITYSTINFILLFFLSTLIIETNSYVRGLGYEEIRLSQPSPSGNKNSPRWVVIGGRIVMPGSAYRVVVETIRSGIRSEDKSITIRASITRDYQQVSFGKVLVGPGDLSNLLLRIPDASVQGKWQLRIEGYEGDGNLPIFKNTTLLKFSPKFLTILIQTSRPVYNAKQTVRFRAVLLTIEQKPYEGPVDCYVLDPKNRIMRRWPSRQTGDGIVNLQFDLPDYPLLGNWTIQIQVRQQVQNKTILVEHYFRPFFEVFVRLPQAFKVTDDEITGVVVANMTNWRYALGNCSIKLQIATNADHPVPTRYETVHQYNVTKFKGFYGFSLPMSAVGARADSLKNVVIRVFASVTDITLPSTEFGWALARIVQEEAKIQFLGDQPLIFRPGMPITVHVSTSYEDAHPFDSDELMYAELTVTLSSTVTLQKFINGTQLIEDAGVTQITFNVPDDARSLEISASFISSSGLTGGATILGIISHSPRNRFLQIETSTMDAFPGENIVFHVRNNFFISYFNYLVVANGQIIYSGREHLNSVSHPSVATFALPASSDMAPVAKILVWVVDQDEEIVANSLAIFVNPLAKHKVSLIWNEAKDYTGGSAEVKFLGEKGSFFAASAIWEETHNMDLGNNLDETRVLLQMMNLEYDRAINDLTGEDLEEIFYGAVPHIRRAYTRSRDGYGSSVKFFPTTFAGPDAPTTFNFSEVVIFTDAMIYYHPSKTSGAVSCKNEAEEDSLRLLQCLTGSCYTIEQRCDGMANCPDASDEAGCFVNVDPYRSFRLYRINRLNRFYDVFDGDWAWEEQRRVGREIKVFSIPKRQQTWIFSFFGVGKTKGLGIWDSPLSTDAAFTFNINVDAPKVVRMWEQVGLIAAIFNFHAKEVAVRITVPSSPDYQTIQVEPNGVVSSYEPRSVNGTFEHLVWLPAGESIDVHIPVIFKRLGRITITFRGDTQIQSDSHAVDIDVIPEGAYIPMHTALLLDLKDRALVYEFLNINLDESPIIPYKLQRRYIFGTPTGHISITGDIVGPAFPEIPANEVNLLGYNVMGAETSAFSFASNIWSLHYMRLTNQVTDSLTFQVLTAANVYYADLCRYQADSGGFFNWIGSEESVWLTAHALKNLWIANFQDWENHIFIDRKIIQAGVNFLLKYQTEVGSFQETVDYYNPLDPKLDPRSRNPKMPSHQNVSLTAHVVITLQSVMTGLEGSLHNRANFAKQRAVRYLERVVQSLTDPYDLAVTAWALTKAESKEKEFAFNALDRKKRVFGDRVYWSRERIQFHDVIYEDSQRPYLQPKGDNRWDAHAVEATAYALMVYMKREGIGILQENVIRFLASMRELDGGVISSLDSLAAKEALVEYSYRARIRDITTMSISIEASASPNSTYEFSAENSCGLAELKAIELENLFGHLTVVGRGSGQALLQLHYVYYIDNAEEKEIPVVPSFNVNTIARFSGKNSSQITITSCQSWINSNESETSGLTVVEIHLPSGYFVMQSKLIEMVQTRRVRNLRWAYITDADVKFFFNKLDSDPVCFTYRVERWHPVSNHSRFGSVRIFELYQPERFEMNLFEVYPLYSLDICEVCGSYQCPYCPFYSATTTLLSEMLTIAICCLLLFYCSSSYTLSELKIL